jgi:hypothetical protein
VSSPGVTAPPVIAIALFASIAGLTSSPHQAGAASDDVFLFSYFTRNGEDGLHLAWSGGRLERVAIHGSAGDEIPVRYGGVRSSFNLPANGVVTLDGNLVLTGLPAR